MEKHVTLVGALHIGYGAFHVLCALLAFTFIAGGGLLGGLVAEEKFVIGITFFIATTIAVWIILVSVPGIIGGIWLLRRKPWARYLVLVVSVLALMDVPLGLGLGLGIGIYSIWVLVQDETAKLFGPCC
ncbi:MAG: hypothetical protein MUP64_16300 [Anaerolineae bacterium]|nr:hypothetical protein [Anaerolineae bacterium]